MKNLATILFKQPYVKQVQNNVWNNGNGKKNRHEFFTYAMITTTGAKALIEAQTREGVVHRVIRVHNSVAPTFEKLPKMLIGSKTILTDEKVIEAAKFEAYAEKSGALFMLIGEVPLIILTVLTMVTTGVNELTITLSALATGFGALVANEYFLNPMKKAAKVFNSTLHSALKDHHQASLKIKGPFPPSSQN